MKKIAIYGGSFDPIHNGHLAFAKAAVEQLGLDELMLVPAAESPHKQGMMRASGQQRLEMCRLAAEGLSNVTVSDIEIARGGVSYTYDTVKELSKPNEMLYLLAGSDQFPTVNRWKYGILLVQRVIIVGGWRGNEERESMEKAADRLRACGCWVELIEFDPVEVSSTDLRQKLAAGQDTGDYLPDSVKKYIEAHGLYRD